MSNDKLEGIFEELKDQFDIELPEINHTKRFMEKLNKQNEIVKKSSFSWKPIIGIAASITLIFALVFSNNQSLNQEGLASVSPEMAKTQDFFANTIDLELKKLEKASNPETKSLIKDALIQINRLENEYQSLLNDLSESGNDQRVIYAMISNYQKRIEILQNTLKQIEIIKQLKTSNNENNNTI